MMNGRKDLSRRELFLRGRWLSVGAADNTKSAGAFAKWLRGEEAQDIFQSYQYDPPGKAPVLRG
jgi:hypothetical protein